jgi:hypothetical protein
VQEVGVEVARARGQLGREHAGLAEAPDAVRRRVAQEVGEPGAEAREVAPGSPAQRLSMTPQNAAGGVPEILRKIEDRGPDRAVRGVDEGVGRAAQGGDDQTDAAPLEGEELLGYERLGDPRVPLDDDHERGSRPGRRDVRKPWGH